MNFGLASAFPGERSAGTALRVVEYKGGSGTFTPLSANSWCRVTIVGGGGGGGRGATTSAAATGGGGGATVIQFVRVPTSTTYVVGASAPGASANNTSGTTGNDSRFGTLVAQGGFAGLPTAGGGVSGGGIDISSTVIVQASLGSGQSGGGGGVGGPAGANPGVGGRAPGYAYMAVTNVPSTTTAYVSSGGAAATNAGGGGGGSSVYGKGGNGGAGHATTGVAGSAGTGYGAGGGGGGAATTSGNGGAGSGGFILIEEFGP